MYQTRTGSKTFKKAAAIFMLFAFLCQPAAAFAGGLTKAEDITGNQTSNIYYGSYRQNWDEVTAGKTFDAATAEEKATLSNYKVEGVKYRVLAASGTESSSTSAGQILLLSDQGLYADAFNSDDTKGNTWCTSEIRGTLNSRTAGSGFAGDAFSAAEYNAITDTTHIAGGGSTTSSTDKLFLLSAEEAQMYGFTTCASRQMTATTMAKNVKMYDNTEVAYVSFNGRSDWWLRSPCDDSDHAYSVNGGGGVYNSYVNTDNNAVRAAFNLNSDSILFASAAEGGKSAVAAGNGFALDDYTGTDYKVTLKTADIATPSNISVTQDKTGYEKVDELAEATAAQGTMNLTSGLTQTYGDVKVSYDGATTGTNKYVSAIVSDTDGNLVNYAKVKSAETESSGTDVIVGTNNLASGEYKMQLFGEEANGDYATDYASNLSSGYTIHKAGANTVNQGSLGAAYKAKGLTAALGNGFNLSFEGAQYDTAVTTAATGASVFGAGSTIASLVIGGNTNVSGSMNVTNLTRSAGTITVNGILTSDKMNATGSNNKLSATGTTVYGTNNIVSGDNSAAFGNNNNISGQNSFVFGNNATTTANNAVLIGVGTKATAESAVAIGNGANASGQHSVALGASGASGNYSFATGWGNTANGSGAFTAGGVKSYGPGKGTASNPNTASGYNAVAFGEDSWAKGDDSFAMGALTTASGDASTAMGAYTTASGGYSTAMGYYTNASGDNSTAIGLVTGALGNSSFAGGASSSDGHNFTRPTAAIGESSFAYGEGVLSGGTAGASFNMSTMKVDWTYGRTGNYTVAMGYKAQAYKDYAVAMGNNTNASGVASFAIGQNSNAAGDYSVAMGQNAEANTANSFAFGGVVTGTATNSVALGQGSSVADNATNSVALGAGSVANASNQISVGSDNVKRQITNVASAGTSLNATENAYHAVNAADVVAETRVSSTGTYNYLNKDNTAAANLTALDKATGKQTTAGKYIAANSDTVSLATNIATLDAALGDKIATDGTYIEKSDTNSINANIKALDEGLGAKPTDTTYATAETVNANIKALDSQLVTTNTALGAEVTRAAAAEKITVGGTGTAVNTSAGTNFNGSSNITLNGTSGNIEVALNNEIAVTSVTAGTSGNKVTISNNSVKVGSDSELTSTQLKVGESTLTGTTLAVGGSTASGDYSTAMGMMATASGEVSTAMGVMATASGEVSTAMGEATTASGKVSTAMGMMATASGEVSTAMGEATTASGKVSTAMGMMATASGKVSTAMGEATTASGEATTAMGMGTGAFGNTSFAGGMSGLEGTDIPRPTAAIGESSFAYGEGVLSGGTAGASFNMSTVKLDWTYNKTGDYTVAMGYRTQAYKDYSVAMGNNTNASGIASFAIGQNTNAAGDYSVAMGQNAEANAANSVALGGVVTGTAANGVALGYGSNASQANSVALGSGSCTSGTYEVSVGSSTQTRKISNVTAVTPASGGTYAATTGQVYNATLTQGAVSGTGNNEVTLKNAAGTALATVDLSGLKTTQGNTLESYFETGTGVAKEATKATKDGNGDVIATTYAKSADVASTYQTKLSETQLAAANSGITSEKVGSYNTHVANGDIHVTADQKTAWNGYDARITTNATAITNITDGTTVVGNATNATNDGAGKNIAATYATKATVNGTYNAASYADNKLTLTKVNGDKTELTITSGGAGSDTSAIHYDNVATKDSVTFGGTAATAPVALKNVASAGKLNDTNSNAATGADVFKATANKADKATTLEGYGITDAYTTTAADAKFATQTALGETNTKVTTAEGKIATAESKIGTLESYFTAGKAKEALHATAADSAIKATQDGNGDVIATTYAKSADVASTYQTKLSTEQLAAANSGITKEKVEAYDSYAKTLEGKADKADTLAGYGIKDAYTMKQVDELIGAGGKLAVAYTDETKTAIKLSGEGGTTISNVKKADLAENGTYAATTGQLYAEQQERIAASVTQGVVAGEGGDRLTLKNAEGKEIANINLSGLKTEQGNTNTAAIQKINDSDVMKSGITADKVGNYDSHVANGDIHVTAEQKTAWSNKAETSYVDEKANTAEQNAKSYTDTKSASALADAKKYSDSNLTTAKTYAEGEAATALKDAKSYTDTQINTEVTNRNTAITNAVAAEATARDTAISTAVSGKADTSYVNAATAVKVNSGSNINTGSGIVLKQGSNIELTTNGNEITITSVGGSDTDAVHYEKTGSTKTNNIVLEGQNAGDKVTIKNVAAGDITSASSTDAVNGGQLYETNEQLKGTYTDATYADSKLTLTRVDGTKTELTIETGGGAISGGEMPEGAQAATATGTGVATGYNSVAADKAVASGFNSTATKEGATAIGFSNTVEGERSTAVGYSNVVTGTGSGAFGDPNIVSGSGSYAIGNNNEIKGDNNFVLGNDVKVDSTVKNSVALGNGSTVTESNVVSVGNETEGGQRRITNVAAGKYATDAATVGQLASVDQRVTNVQNQVAQNSQETREVGAMSAALAGLHYVEPSGEGDDKFTGAVAYGGFRGESAAALGVAYKPSPNLMVSASTSVGNSQNMYNAGVAFKFGPGKTVNRAAMAKQIKYLGEENSKLKAENAAQSSEIQQLKQNLNSVLERLEKLEKKK